MDERAKDETGQETDLLDHDGDGYASDVDMSGTDCDDDDPDIHPDAEEIWYDGVDQNCDGADDFDQDGDGYDASGSGTGDDCDDTNPLANPGEIERCDTPFDDDCDGETNGPESDGCTTLYIDQDGDGHGGDLDACLCAATDDYTASSGDDCDDDDSSVYTGAPETVGDGVDEDCDGLERCYVDIDDDGYRPDETVSSSALDCSDAGMTSEALPDGDCDDGDNGINPGEAEIPGDGVDQDCDGLEACYQDEDGDGYRPDDAVSLSSDPLCDGAGEADATSLDGDCNDEVAWINPAGTEICDTHDSDEDSDEDCDGLADDDDDSVDVGTMSTWYADADDDGYGDPDRAALACDRPEGTVRSGLDCDDEDSGVNPAATEVCDGVDDDCDGGVDDAEAADRSTWYSDDDGDGYGDAATSELSCDQPDGYVADATDCDDDDGEVNPGETEVCDDGKDDDCDGAAPDCGLSGEIGLASAQAKLVGENPSDYLGTSSAQRGVAFASDVDGDGRDDLIVGSLYNDRGGSNSGAAYLVLGTVSGSLDVSSADAIYTGEDPGDYAGGAVDGAGDVDGDGYADLIIGALEDDSGGTDAGAAYLIQGDGDPASLDLSAAPAKLVGERAGDYAGFSVAGTGDFDGDGLDDVIVGAPNESSTDAGAAYVVLGPVGSVDLDSADVKLTGSTDDALGFTVTGGLDCDADGYADPLVGQVGSSSTDGSVWLVSGGDYSGTYRVTDAGIEFSHAPRESVYPSTAGDLDGDGYGDFIIGDPVGGKAYLFDCPRYAAGDVRAAPGTFVGSASEDSGISVGGGGDVDRDGYDDVIIGADTSDLAGADSGTAFLFFGGSLSGTIRLSDSDATLEGEDPSDYAGNAVALGGDANMDGYADLLIAAPGDDSGGSSSGAAYLVLGGGI